MVSMPNYWMSGVMRNEDQRLEDFQPLSKAANDAKRQFGLFQQRNFRPQLRKLLGLLKCKEVRMRGENEGGSYYTSEIRQISFFCYP